MSATPISSAADRNKQPILEVLRQVLPERGSGLEIASGTGQHVVWFAAGTPEWIWQPTDAAVTAFPAITAAIEKAGLLNVRAPLRLDVLSPRWPGEGPPFFRPFDAIYCANMLHIAPWATCGALMRGAARHLSADGVLVTYGPYFEENVPTAPSNLAFHQSLRLRNAAWGIRRLQDVQQEAQLAGLRLAARHEMPANNLLLVWERAGAQ